MENFEPAEVCQLSDPLESSTMELLPDEVLLLVMKHMDVRDLIRCRLVCKRLARLAVDPDVWRHRHHYDDNPWACAVLRLAPCLNSLNLWAVGTCHRSQLSRTKCAAARLNFGYLWGWRDNGNLEEGVQVILNQKALGRLKGLIFDLPEMEGVAAAKLLDISMSIPGLEELSISGYGGYMPRMTTPRSVSSCASLKALRLKWLEKMGNSRAQPLEVFKFLLAEHAGTLEKVELKNKITVMSAPAALLASMPNLRELRCSPLSEMKALAASTSLRKLKLTVTLPVAVGPETREFLRRANQLRDVTLKYSCFTFRDKKNWVWKSSTTGVDLVFDLASSGRSSVETLRIYNKKRYLPQVQPLVRALPLLTHLRHLHVEVAPDELLVAITPATAPALRSLVTRESNWGCVHAWLHKAEVKKLLWENPALHVEIHSKDSICDTHPCLMCVTNCHLDAWCEGAIFFTHVPEDKCQLPEMHTILSCYISDVSTLETLTMAPPLSWCDLPNRD